MTFGPFFQVPGGRVGRIGAHGPDDLVRVDGLPDYPYFAWLPRSVLIPLDEERATALRQAWIEVENIR